VVSRAATSASLCENGSRPKAIAKIRMRHSAIERVTPDSTEPRACASNEIACTGCIRRNNLSLQNPASVRGIDEISWDISSHEVEARSAGAVVRSIAINFQVGPDTQNPSIAFWWTMQLLRRSTRRPARLSPSAKGG